MAFRRRQTRKWDAQREIGTFLGSEVAEKHMNPECCQGCEEMTRCTDFFIISFWFRAFGTMHILVFIYTTVFCLSPSLCFNSQQHTSICPGNKLF